MNKEKDYILIQSTKFELEEEELKKHKKELIKKQFQLPLFKNGLVTWDNYLGYLLFYKLTQKLKNQKNIESIYQELIYQKYIPRC